LGPYLKFHPGGEGELLRAAGKEGGRLFDEVHPWVNWEGMLGGCIVGIAVAEGDGDTQGGGLEDMD
jgi:cytochrome b involved in lipid metabolism